MLLRMFYVLLLLIVLATGSWAGWRWYGRYQERKNYYVPKLKPEAEQPVTLSLSELEAAIKKQGPSPTLCYQLGSAYMEAGRDTEAAVQFSKAVELKPRHPDALYKLGVLNDRNQRIDQAIVLYEQALEINPYHEKARTRSQELKNQRNSQSIEQAEERRDQLDYRSRTSR